MRWIFFGCICVSSWAFAGDLNLQVETKDAVKTEEARIILVDKTGEVPVHIDPKAQKAETEELMESHPGLGKMVKEIKTETVENPKFKQSLKVLYAVLKKQGRKLRNPVVFVSIRNPYNFNNLRRDELQVAKAEMTELRADIEEPGKSKTTVVVSGEEQKPLKEMPEIIKEQLAVHDLKQDPGLTTNQKLAIGAGVLMAFTPPGRVVALTLGLVACGSGGDGGSGGGSFDNNSNSTTPQSLSGCNCEAQLAWQRQYDAEMYSCYYDVPGGSNWKDCGTLVGGSATSMITKPFSNGTWDITLRAAVWNPARGDWEYSDYSERVQFTAPRPN